MSCNVVASRKGTERSALNTVASRSGFLCCILGLLISVRVQAAPIVTLASGVANPPATVGSTGLADPRYALSDIARVVPVGDVIGVLQETLDLQGFTAANHWSLDTGTVTLGDDAAFHLTNYGIVLNGAGTRFGDKLEFTLNSTLEAPDVAGATVTAHWLQLVHTDRPLSGFGYSITGVAGAWQLDNGRAVGQLASGAIAGPYYDSNATPGLYSTPPTYYDFARYYSALGTYLHFTTIPVYDVYVPAVGALPATETIYVADYGLAWGFAIVPEPSSVVLFVIGVTGAVVMVGSYRRREV